MLYTLFSLLLSAGLAAHGLRKRSLAPAGSTGAMQAAWCICPAIVAALGYGKGSLSGAGAAAAFCVGCVHMLAGPSFGLTLIAFYYSSSKLTKFKAHIKQQLEKDFKDGGQRSPAQVLANSLGSAVFAALAAAAASKLIPQIIPQPALLTGFLAYLACCCADTWASELGILSRANPRLVTSFRQVPKGTNGGVSLLGTAAGAGGGLFVGAVFYGCSVLLSSEAELRLPKARQNFTIALAAGVAGNLIDSLFGATLQYSGLDERLQKVVARPGPGVKHISGLDVLSNTGINFLSATLTACIAATGIALHVLLQTL